MKLALSPIELSDIDELVRLQFLAFADSGIHTALFGRGDPAKAKATRDHLKALADDPCNIWLKVTDFDTGKMISASNWRVFPTWVPKEEPKKEVDWFEDEDDLQSAKDIVEYYGEKRKQYMTAPHIFLYILFVAPEYQRHGVGGIHMKWGTDLADRMFLPMWVEASKYGHGLYKAHGFEDVEDVVKPTKSFTMHYVMMYRPQKVSKMLIESRKEV